MASSAKDILAGAGTDIDSLKEEKRARGNNSYNHKCARLL